MKRLIFNLLLAAMTSMAVAQERPSRLTLGGYGEAVMTRNFYSDKYMRYTDAANYKDAASHGRADLPHVVFFVGYDFGKGWTMSSEIEFEHGGTESAMEIEEEEGGEYESEVERGGEVALEQFWIQKSWSRAINLRMGHIIVPIGATNQHHLPTEFFTVYRPEGENTIMPCTWHETGVSLWGRTTHWRYEAQVLAGLDSDRFGRQGWIHDGAGSPYEFKIANNYAVALRIDNYSFSGLRMAVSGYAGNTFKNTLSATDAERYKDAKGTVLIGAFDFTYNKYNWVARGNFDYGHLNDSELITRYNKTMRNDSPSPKQDVASDAIAYGIEVGYDVFSQIEKMRGDNQRLYLFSRYEGYDSMFKTSANVMDYAWCGCQRIAAGFNYYPMSEIVIKAEYSHRFMAKGYNDEPSVSVGVAYSGFFR